ncbi:ABC transporter ATP-binding protein [Roseovarius indicus]|uniref:Peptide ABC transporter ATP-binding protein n=1 Tax=Roseovarius indicus TaxID=540747 RepID=A0A0T5P1L2_9RHOB|nr:ABC transporter ATP-binding protein [Roseovarius indicus]KRS15029.1 peptide ABC transporter ATP-binding protein [Roseovarius indicus]QEW25349.1 Stage 0 sporulation protein KD [Roseovarius indicus]SFE21217.1 peptide/nickel transport system ATP-binding protein [Roseovarius indicus]
MTAEASGLQVRGLTVDYRSEGGRIHALRNVDIEVPAGSIVGVVGESGCGKSSVISSIIRQLPENADVTGGTIGFGGNNLLDLSKPEMRRIMGDRISVVFQNPMTSLNPIRSIGKQMIDIQYRSGRSKAEKRKVAIDMLNRVGVTDPEARLDQYSYQFSGGMCQRIAIAMALMAEPSLLIADEPTTALDATLEVQIVDLLKNMQQELGCSILFVSHHLGVIAELCDHVVVLYAGEVVEQGAVRDIFHRPAHPYTRRLMECEPGMIETVTRRLPSIAGEVPGLVNLPKGCIFADRCTERFARCEAEHPELQQISDSHRVACHLADENGGRP